MKSTEIDDRKMRELARQYDEVSRSEELCGARLAEIQESRARLADEIVAAIMDAGPIVVGERIYEARTGGRGLAVTPIGRRID